MAQRVYKIGIGFQSTGTITAHFETLVFFQFVSFVMSIRLSFQIISNLIIHHHHHHHLLNLLPRLFCIKMDSKYIPIITNMHSVNIQSDSIHSSSYYKKTKRKSLSNLVIAESLPLQERALTFQPPQCRIATPTLP